ncbi:hypothetical protein [Tahibacter sp.]|uniref:hypothetical protein n=1 Tax=Tahibacter sp. TaxID=2056211 RepID=UPI0028C3C8DE|nr:hypothetical protein [Tahibacter sp.]
MQRTCSLFSALLRPLSLALVALASAGTAHADARYVEPQASVAIDPIGFVQGHDGSFWTFSLDGVRHTDANGRTITLYRGPALPDPDDPVFIAGVATDDGGLIAYDGHCNLLRVTGDLRATWTKAVPFLSCKAVDANAQGISWIGGPAPGDGDNFHELAPDGGLRWRVRIGGIGALIALEQLVAFKALADDDLVVLSRSNVMETVFARYRGGDRVWQWRGEPDIAQKFELAADGGVWGVGLHAGSLWTTRLNAQGQLQYSRAQANADIAVYTLAAAPDNALYSVTGENMQFGRARTLVRIGADGQVAWLKTLCPGAAPGAPVLPDIIVGADGSVANVCESSGQQRLVRRNPAGAVTSETVLPFARTLELQSAPDGTLLVLGRERVDAPFQTRLIAVDAANQIRPTVIGELTDSHPLQLLAAQINADGSSYLVTQNAYVAVPPQRYTVSKIGADATVLWRRELPGLALHSAQIETGHGLACVSVVSDAALIPGSARKPMAQCLDASTGALVGRLHDAPADQGIQMQVWPLSGGRVIVVRRAPEFVETQVFIDDQLVNSRRTASTADRVAIDPIGRVTTANSLAVGRANADLSPDFLLSPSELVSYQSDFALDEDGGLFIAGRPRVALRDVATLWSISPGGTTRWLAPLSLKDSEIQLVGGAQAVFALEYRRAGTGTPGAARVSRIERADGHTAWTYDLEFSATGPGRLALSADGTQLLIASAHSNRLRLERLRADVGIRTHRRDVYCGDTCDAPLALRDDAAGAARVVGEITDRVGGSTAAILRLDRAVTDTPRIDVGQPGVAGLWHAPYANGEGLAIDWLPGSNTLFAAWFTHDWGGVFTSRRSLRWYTLQVNGVPAGTTELELPVLRTIGGNFAAGPAVSPYPRPVGKAWLSFSDCSNATLRYQLFDQTEAGSGAKREGTLTLSRLTPATRDCRLADGSSQPGAGARPPAKGFDARLSGAWYDPAALGQGLQLNIQPDGVFFAPWFTYDPEGAYSQSRQHWFTLQGDLAQARDGRVDLRIIQTTGGGFDSLPTYNANVVGIATLTVLGCDRATLDYRFTDPLVSGPFADRSGQLALTRMGDCAP